MSVEYRRGSARPSRNRQRAAQQRQEIRQPHHWQPQPQILRDPWRQRFPRQVKPQGDRQDQTDE